MTPFFNDTFTFLFQGLQGLRHTSNDCLATVHSQFNYGHKPNRDCDFIAP